MFFMFRLNNSEPDNDDNYKLLTTVAMTSEAFMILMNMMDRMAVAATTKANGAAEAGRAPKRRKTQ